MIDLADIQFKTRNGYEWKTEPYTQLIQKLHELEWQDRLLTDFVRDEIEILVKACYEKWGDHRPDYFNALQNFFEKYSSVIREDCILFRDGYKLIPPGLKALRLLLKKLVDVMVHPKYKYQCDKYGTDPRYKVPANIRRALAEDIINNDTTMTRNNDYDKIFRKLSRVLHDHRDEMCKIFKLIHDNNEPTGKPTIGNREEDRRTVRLLELERKRNQIIEMEKNIENATESGLKKIYISESIGHGVIALRNFEKDEFVIEYAGNLLTRKEAKALRAVYNEDPTIGSYILDFNCNNCAYSIDATEDNGRLGRLINHSKNNPNLKLQAKNVCGKPRVLLFASRFIESGEELRYDYGDKSAESLKNNPWLDK